MLCHFRIPSRLVGIHATARFPLYPSRREPRTHRFHAHAVHHTHVRSLAHSLSGPTFPLVSVGSGQKPSIKVSELNASVVLKFNEDAVAKSGYAPVLDRPPSDMLVLALCDHPALPDAISAASKPELRATYAEKLVTPEHTRYTSKTARTLREFLFGAPTIKSDRNVCFYWQGEICSKVDMIAHPVRLHGDCKVRGSSGCDVCVPILDVLGGWPLCVFEKPTPIRLIRNHLISMWPAVVSSMSFTVDNQPLDDEEQGLQSVMKASQLVVTVNGTPCAFVDARDFDDDASLGLLGISENPHFALVDG